MKEFIITHIHCGMITTITGYDFYSACRAANKTPTLWKIIEENNI